MPLDPSNVPQALVPLLPIAERWGIGDDFEREEAVSRADRQDLEVLIHSIDGFSDEELFGWLSGDESYSHNPSAEYLAISNLTMAIDSAKAKLQRIHGS